MSLTNYIELPASSLTAFWVSTISEYDMLDMRNQGPSWEPNMKNISIPNQQKLQKWLIGSSENLFKQ